MAYAENMKHMNVVNGLVKRFNSTFYFVLKLTIFLFDCFVLFCLVFCLFVCFLFSVYFWFSGWGSGLFGEYWKLASLNPSK